MRVNGTAIGDRIGERLRDMRKSAAWLARQADVERSTISRIIKGERTPTPETIVALAPPLKLTPEELAAGTEVEIRVDATVNVVAKHHFEEAVRQVIVYEREANDLREKLRRAQEQVDAEQDRRRRAELALDAARESADRHERAAGRYEAALGRAVADVARLQTEIQELGKLVDDSRKTGRITAILAGTAAAAATSVAAYLAAGARKSKRDGTNKKG